MTLPDWSAAAEQAVTPILDKWIDAYGLPPALVYAIVAQESRFNPSAYRAEPALNDASYGLTQILLATARTLGYTGTAAGLYDPDTNARLGLLYLLQLLDRFGGNEQLATSAYNGGYRSGAIINPDYVAGVQAREQYFSDRTGPIGGTVVYDSSTGITGTAGGGLLAMLFSGLALGLLWQHFRGRL